MASRIIHLAITKNVLKTMSVQEENRIYLGAVLPDAYHNGISTNISHFKEEIFDGTKKTYNLTKFRTLFLDKMLSDDLYLGYYLHLIQDIVYRQFVYDDYKWNPRIPGNIQKLHNDYRLINTYVIKNYGIQNFHVKPERFQEEEINKVYPFDLKQLLNDMKDDFIPYSEGDIFFFTERMADEYITRAVEVCLQEIKALKEKLPLLDEIQYAWRKN